MQYLWDLTAVYVKDIDGNPDVVCGFDANMCCKDDQGRVGLYPVFVPVDTSDLTTFTPFTDLTRAQVFSWADAAFTAEDLLVFKAEALKRCAVFGCTVKYAAFGPKFSKE